MRRVRTTAPLLPVPAGMDNVHSADHAVFNIREGERGLLPPQALREAYNVDISSDGRIAARAGASRVIGLTNGRKLVAKGGAMYVLDGETLYQLSPSSPTQLTSLVDSLDTSAPFLMHNWPSRSSQVLMACGSVHRIIDGTVKSWGLPVPQEILHFPIAGELDPATYLCAATFLDGPLEDPATQESGALAPTQVTLEAVGGIRLAVLVPNPTVTHVSFYISGPDQPEVFRAITVSVVTSEAGVRGAGIDFVTKAGVSQSETPLLVQGWGPPLLGMTALGSLQSYILAGVGKALYRSWPGRPGLFYYARAFQLFPSEITSILGLQDGAYVCTKGGTYWLSGSTADVWARRKLSDEEVLPEGIVMDGKEFPALETEELVAIFVTRTGVMAGLPGGKLLPLTRDKYHFPDAARVSITYRTAPRRQLFIASSVA